MQFCPICAARLIQTSNQLFCQHCGYKSEIHTKDQRFTIKTISNLLPTVEVLEGDVLNLEVLPTIEAFCEECAHKIRAETWAVAMGSEKLSNVIFYRCTFCGHTWRTTV